MIEALRDGYLAIVASVPLDQLPAAWRHTDDGYRRLAKLRYGLQRVLQSQLIAYSFKKAREREARNEWRKTKEGRIEMSRTAYRKMRAMRLPSMAPPDE